MTESHMNLDFLDDLECPDKMIIEPITRKDLQELNIFWDAEERSLNLLKQKVMIWGLRDRDLTKFRGFM